MNINTKYITVSPGEKEIPAKSPSKITHILTSSHRDFLTNTKHKIQYSILLLLGFLLCRLILRWFIFCWFILCWLVLCGLLIRRLFLFCFLGIVVSFRRVL